MNLDCLTGTGNVQTCEENIPSIYCGLLIADFYYGKTKFFLDNCFHYDGLHFRNTCGKYNNNQLVLNILE